MVSSDDENGGSTYCRYPLLPIRLPYSEEFIGGDSGNPAFLVLNGEPVLLTTWTVKGPGQGTAVTSFKSDINQLMSDLDEQHSVTNGYQLTEIDLSIFQILTQ